MRRRLAIRPFMAFMKKLICWLLGHAAPHAPVSTGKKWVEERGGWDCWEVFRCPRGCGHVWESHLMVAPEDLD